MTSLDDVPDKAKVTIRAVPKPVAYGGGGSVAGRRNFTLLVSSPNNELFADKKKCILSASSVEELTAELQKNLSLAVPIGECSTPVLVHCRHS